MTEPTANRISQLSRWAQDYIYSLRRANMEAARFAKASEDRDTPSAVSYVEAVCDNPSGGPSFRKRYIQTKNVSMTNGGVVVALQCDAIDQVDGVRITAVDEVQDRSFAAAFVPNSHGGLFVRAIPRVKGGAS